MFNKCFKMTKRTKIIIGVLAGIAIIGGVWYFYNYTKVNKKITIAQKKDRRIDIINTDY